jgi:uncharacterized protein YdhG (YjbR/CyaY superfamily)
MAEKPATVDEYIAGHPGDVQQILREVRARLHAAVPGAEERIRYGMPAIMLGGRYAIHFAAWKKHLGLYPVPRFDGLLEQRVAPHREKTDTLSFPYALPIDYDLIEEIAAAIVTLRKQQ